MLSKSIMSLYFVKALGGAHKHPAYNTEGFNKLN